MKDCSVGASTWSLVALTDSMFYDNQPKLHKNWWFQKAKILVFLHIGKPCKLHINVFKSAVYFQQWNTFITLRLHRIFGIHTMLAYFYSITGQFITILPLWHIKTLLPLNLCENCRFWFVWVDCTASNCTLGLSLGCCFLCPSAT